MLCGKISIFTNNKKTTQMQEEDAQIINVTTGGTYIYHLALKG